MLLNQVVKDLVTGLNFSKEVIELPEFVRRATKLLQTDLIIHL